MRSRRSASRSTRSTTVGETVPGVVTARVLRLEQHPDAAKVQRVYVDAGDGAERHVWCGAFNMAEGDIVPLATLGTTMPNGMTIERRGILGIDSEGMLCSASELGLGDDHSGIRVLPSDVPLGRPYGEALGLSLDVLIDADVTRNRPDCWGYVGIARDLAAKMGVEFRPPTADAGRHRRRTDGRRRDRRRRPLRPLHLHGDLRHRGQAVGRLDGTAAHRRRHAPDQQRRRRQQLRDAGTQPAEPRLRPRHARWRRVPDPPGQATASSSRRSTARSARSRRTTCSSATPTTFRSVSAGSWAASTPRSATRPPRSRWRWLGSRSSGSARPSPEPTCARRHRRASSVASILTACRWRSHGSSSCCRRPVRTWWCTPAPSMHVATISLPNTAPSPVRISAVNRILGTDLTADDLPALLDPIGFTVSGSGATRDVVLPSWRLDSTEEVDVIEEVARHYGYDRLGKTVPKSVVHGELSVRQRRRRLAREVLLGLGISEAMPNPFLAPDTLAKAALAVGGAADHQPARGRRERPADLAASRSAPLGRLQRIPSPPGCGAVRDRTRLSARRG